MFLMLVFAILTAHISQQCLDTWERIERNKITESATLERHKADEENRLAHELQLQKYKIQQENHLSLAKYKIDEENQLERDMKVHELKLKKIEIEIEKIDADKTVSIEKLRSEELKKQMDIWQKHTSKKMESNRAVWESLSKPVKVEGGGYGFSIMGFDFKVGRGKKEVIPIDEILNDPQKYRRFTEALNAGNDMDDLRLLN